MKATAMKLGLGMAMATATVVGCAAPSAEDDAQGAAPAPAVADGDVTPNDTTVSLNCGVMYPGGPQLPCKPDLRFTQTLVQVWEPNNPQNMAPGYYIHFGFMNDSDKATGPFRVKIKDQYGTILKTQHFADLAAHASTSMLAHGPYTCGWSRTAVLDADFGVDEYSESNNTSTYSYMCPKIILKGL